MIMSIYIKEKNLVKILETINACKKLLEDGGDWERKNRLKVIILNMIRYINKLEKGRHYELLRKIRDFSRGTVFWEGLMLFYNKTRLI